LAPHKTAEQAAPDRPALGVDCALCAVFIFSRRACGTQQRSPRGVGTSLIWPQAGHPSFPLLHHWSRDRSQRCLSVKARRAVSSPAAAGRTPLRFPPWPPVSRRPGCSRAMNSGKTAATATSPGHCAEPTEANTGLRILESGQLW